MVYKFPLSVPTYNSKQDSWSTTEFETVEDLKQFILPLFKEPGKYDFDALTDQFNEQSRNFYKQKRHYCVEPFGSKAFKEYWNTEKRKCRRGVIYTDEVRTYFVPRDYYHFLNFVQIPYKDRVEPDFPTIWDGHYHMALYELLSELHYKHAGVLKKRQFGASLYHVCKVLNVYWFEKTAVLKMGASLKTYLGMDDGAWKFLTMYRDFMNEHTAWYRPNQPDTVGNWIQRVETTTVDGKKFYKGNKSSIVSTSFEKNPTAGVGGACTYFFHEEGGVAPKADQTLSYMDAALKFGLMRTGMFIISGSVGELSQCGPLENFIRKDDDFYRVETNLLDDKGTIGKAGLFIPEQWNMPPYIDSHGNSQVQEALAAIMVERARWEEMVRKGEKTEEQKRIEFSQHPINIEEAFRFRKESKFPTHLIQHQLKRIDDKEVAVEYLDIERDPNGGFIWTQSNRIPLIYPTEKTIPDKRGCVIVTKRPTKELPEFGMHYASVDTVGEGKTITSDSLFCIQIYEVPIERTVLQEGKEPVLEIEGDRIVATWTGRFDDPNDTHELASMLIEAYNAWTIVEVNVSLFITYMILKKRQRWLVPKNQIVFLKEVEANQQSFQEYGWKNTGKFFKDNLLRYGIDFVKEIIDEEVIVEGKAPVKTFGVTRIPDRWLLQEMLIYDGEVNVDRLVTFCALVAFVKLQVANRGYKKITEKRKENLAKSQDLYKLKVQPFRHIGNSNSQGLDSVYKVKKSTFKHLK